MDSIFEHYVYLLGIISCPNPSESREINRSNEEKIIDLVENSQLTGSIRREAIGLPKLVLRISKRGIQLTNSDKSTTYQRVPLLNIVFTVSYEDVFGKFNYVVVEKKTDDNQMLHVFHTESRGTAELLSQDMETVFKNIQEECQREEAQFNPTDNE